MTVGVRAYRVVFAVGAALVCSSFAAGLVSAWWRQGRLPGFDQSPLLAAQRAEQAGDRAAAAREHHAMGVLNGASLRQALQAAEQLAWLGDAAGAGELLEQAESRAPGSHAVQVALSWVLIHQNRAAAAEPRLREALRRVPGDAHAHAGLGEALSSRGRFQEAVGSFRRSLELDPSAASVHNSLGIALARIGRPGEAISAFQAALALGPNPSAAANLERARAELVQRPPQGSTR